MTCIFSYQMVRETECGDPPWSLIVIVIPTSTATATISVIRHAFITVLQLDFGRRDVDSLERRQYRECRRRDEDKVGLAPVNEMGHV